MGKACPYLLQPYNKLAPKPHLRSAPLLEEEQKGLLQDQASEDPAADSGLKAVSLLKQRSPLARNTPLLNRLHSIEYVRIYSTFQVLTVTHLLQIILQERPRVLD